MGWEVIQSCAFNLCSGISEGSNYSKKIKILVLEKCLEI